MITMILFGATGGIGAALLRMACRQHSHLRVYLPLRHGAHPPAVATTEHQQLIPLSWDSNDDASTDALTQHIHQPIDICLSAIGALHNHDYQPEKKLSQINNRQLAWTYHANAIVNAGILRAISPKMAKKTPSIMGFLSARVGSISDNRLGGWYAYRSAKAALNMLIKTASIEMARYNKQLCIIGIHPGTVDTELSKPFQSRVPNPQLFSPDQSAEAIFGHILNVVTSQYSGKVLAWDGTVIPE
ncbi:MAG: SDR family NAD(P)-dependent oxidoreductase, partial [Candidatus Marinamargulisbacteria bacterium]